MTTSERERDAAGAPFVGRAMRRVEDARFLTGAARYVADVRRDRMCHAAIVRSAHAHARLRGIDTRAALAAPGVVAVLTAADLGDQARAIPLRLAPLPGFDRYLQEPIARERVRFVGEAVAVVIAGDRYAAEDAAEQVAVEYEALPPVVDAGDAMADRVLIHEATGTNVASRYRVSRGDPEAAFARAEYTRREVFRCHRHGAMPLETRGLVAEWDGAAGTMRVWGATKVPFFNRSVLARMLGLAESCVELVEVDVGGSFGVRGEFYPEDFLIPFAAMRLGRPVMWIEGRREHLLAANHSREIECELEIAARRDGTILGLRARIVADMGAYARTNGGVVPAKAAQFLPGPYRIADVDCEVLAVITNKTPVATYRGPGRFEANFFRERLLDLTAGDLGLDPVALRLANLVTPAEMPYAIGALVPYDPPAEYDTGDYPSALRRALAAIDYPRLAALNGTLVDGRRQGIGVACFVESSGAGPVETARIAVRGAGRVDLYTGCASSGQGHETVMAQIAADELGVPCHWVTVFHGTTTLVDHGYGTYHSRAVVVGGSAVKMAAAVLGEQLVALAARRTGIAREDLEVRGIDVHRRDGCRAEGERGGDGPPARSSVPVGSRREGSTEPDGRPTLVLGGAALAAEDSPEASAALEAVGRFRPGALTYTYGAHIAHVAVDPETGAVEVLRFVAVEDVGRAINPLLVHGQAVGAAVQGLGGAFLERLAYDEAGQLLTGTFMEYAMPTAAAFPRVDAITLEEAPSRLNPLGAKGAGEGGIVATGAAAANAVAAALAPLGGVVRELPLSPGAVAGILSPRGGGHSTSRGSSAGGAGSRQPPAVAVRPGPGGA
jgi:carbon-monoxide dehydrogenase large subunit